MSTLFYELGILLLSRSFEFSEETKTKLLNYLMISFSFSQESFAVS